MGHSLFPAVGLDSGPIRTPASSERQLATFELLPGKTLAQRLVEGDATSDRGIHDEKVFFLAPTAFIVLAAAPAQAADMYARPAYPPPPAAPLPVYTWTGMYWGANVGYSWGKSKY